jgi:hypothetical protein
VGIDIYLNGYAEYEARIAHLKPWWDAAIKARDDAGEKTEWGKEPGPLQRRVLEISAQMNAGNVGYLRSSYNSAGLFTVLEEIFGLDVAAYLFPGTWEPPDVVIDGREFVLKVAALEATTLLALERKQLTLPWVGIFTEITGERAPDPNETRVHGEAFGRQVFGMISQLAPDVDKVDPQPRDPFPQLGPQHGPQHGWYLTTGMRQLREFGELAAKLNVEGHATHAHISY